MKPKVLIVDDEEDFLKECSSNLTSNGCICEIFLEAECAYEKVISGMYDIVICDVLIPFRGQREGGILLAQEFSEKYPTSSIILISQYFTARWIRMLSGSSNHAYPVASQNTIPTP